MAALPILRQERFALFYLRHGNAAHAYKQAGYATKAGPSTWNSASRLLGNAGVRVRINELRRQMSFRKRVTVESLLDELAEARALALRVDQPSAAIQATQVAAKLVGLMVERKETGQPGDFASLASQEEIVAKVRADLGDDFATALAETLAKLGASEASKPAPLALPHPDAFPQPSHTTQEQSAEES